LINIPHIELLVKAAVFLPDHDVLALVVFAFGDIENSLVLDVDEVSILISEELEPSGVGGEDLKVS